MSEAFLVDISIHVMWVDPLETQLNITNTVVL